MLIKTITYTDYNGTERTEPFYFNLTTTEVKKMDLTTTGGLVEHINKIIAAQDMPEIYRLFEEFIFKAYGVKSADGKYLDKSEELSRAFSHTEAYNVLMEEITSDGKKAADFFNAIIPNAPKQDTPLQTPNPVPAPVN